MGEQKEMKIILAVREDFSIVIDKDLSVPGYFAALNKLQSMLGSIPASELLKSELPMANNEGIQKTNQEQKQEVNQNPEDFDLEVGFDNN